jgi:hypothetical protein
MEPINAMDAEIKMVADNRLPPPGTKIKCINNQTRPELVEGQIYTVAFELALDKMPMNPTRSYPDDFRFIAVKMQGQKDNGIFPFGIFELVE